MYHFFLANNRTKNTSSIILTSATLLICAIQLATAQTRQPPDVDPAIAACSTVTLSQLPKTTAYTVVGATISNTDVNLLLHSTQGLPTSLLKTCHFTADKEDGKFRLIRAKDPRAQECMELVDKVTSIIRAGALDRAKEQKEELERCQAVLKLELKAEAEYFSHAVKLIGSSNYPIEPKDTALR